MLTGKSRWADKAYISGGDKELILKQVKLVRDAPSESQYLEREKELFKLTENLHVRAGQSLKEMLFKDYYTKNWKTSSFRWVLAFRKNLPTKGCNDTQVKYIFFLYIYK